MVCGPQEQKTKKSELSLEKDAKSWFVENYGAKFATGNPDFFGWHYSAGMLMFNIPHVGFYYYKHVIKMIHFFNWKEKSFGEGYKYYQRYNPQRHVHIDDNPYSASNFYNNCGWSWGFILRLQEENSKFRLKILK